MLCCVLQRVLRVLCLITFVVALGVWVVWFVCGKSGLDW